MSADMYTCGLWYALPVLIVHACTRRIAIVLDGHTYILVQKMYHGTVYSLCTASSISLFSRGSGALLGREIDVSIGQGG